MTKQQRDQIYDNLSAARSSTAAAESNASRRVFDPRLYAWPTEQQVDRMVEALVRRKVLIDLLGFGRDVVSAGSPERLEHRLYGVIDEHRAESAKPSAQAGCVRLEAARRGHEAAYEDYRELLQAYGAEEPTPVATPAADAPPAPGDSPLADLLAWLRDRGTPDLRNGHLADHVIEALVRDIAERKVRADDGLQLVHAIGRTLLAASRRGVAKLPIGDVEPAINRMLHDSQNSDVIVVRAIPSGYALAQSTANMVENRKRARDASRMIPRPDPSEAMPAPYPTGDGCAR